MPSVPTPEVWAQIRYEYEQTRRTVEDICFAYGITPNTLRRRGRRWGWGMRHPPIPDEGPEAVAPPGLPLPHSPSKTGVNALLPEEGWGEDHFQTGELAEPPPLTRSPSLHSDDRPLPQAGEVKESEPSPHIGTPIATAADTRPIGERLQGAVGRVLPAIETTLARLTAGPTHPREMELAARALGSLTRTLRELNGLLNQHPVKAVDDDPPPEDMDEFRNELARRITALLESREAEIPAKYEAAWNEFAAEAKQASEPVL